MHWTPTVCAGVMFGRQPQDPRNFKWKHGTGMETNSVKWMKKQKLFMTKCLSWAQLPALPSLLLSEDFMDLKARTYIFVHFWEDILWQEEHFSFQFITFFVFFFPFPSFISCRRWHITISGQKSSLLSSSRETVPVLHFRLTSGGALKACWLNFLSFPLDTLFKHDAWRSA